MSSTPEERAARRTEVHRLAHEVRLTQRAIAARLGISKETVKRDLRLTPSPDAGDPHQGSPNVAQGSDGAPHDPTVHVPPVTHPDPGAPPMTQPLRPADPQGSGPVRPGPRPNPASLAEAPGPPSRETRAALAAKAQRAAAAMHQLAAAVAEVVDARVPYVFVTEDVATDWAAQLRQHAQTLVHERQQFADYYAGALVAGATVSRRRATDAPPAPTPPTAIRDTDPAPPSLRLRTQPPPDEAA
ncbi:hypothetical protein [Streptomyces niveus]|uniref:hypothetical protein n=1 Tax=Streptomyces niveus TaxID=193462 RepID=UPI0036D35764